MTKKRVIGKNGKLPWHIAEEMQNFKKLTMGNVVIMGRKTFESIGKPLPDRTNIVVSTSLPSKDGIVVCRSVTDALAQATTFESDIFIIGGATIYEEMLPFADTMYLSYIKQDYEGDTFFPKFNQEEWTIETKEDHDEFELVVYQRK